MRCSRVIAIALGLAGLLLAVLLSSKMAAAHPHAFIDITVEVQFDDAGRVTALKQSWLFDEFYTADTVQKGEQKKMDALMTRILGNLKEYGYFTRVRAAGRPVALAEPTGRSARMDGHRLRMGFTTPLAEPVAVGAKPLTYSVYDPFYYIEMLHAQSDDAIRLHGAPPNCRAKLLPLAPDPKVVAKAAALDRTQTSDNGLGAQFAETVEITCAASP
jgi:ABC-type uncharacterized transport system substrate-binding protein